MSEKEMDQLFDAIDADRSGTIEDGELLTHLIRHGHNEDTMAQLFREQAGEPPDKLDLKEVGEFLAGVLSLWQLIREMAAAAGGDVGYLCTEKIFQDFFELGPGDGAPAGSDPASPFSTAPAVGTDFGDWRVSGGVLLVQALPVPDGQ